MKFNDLKNFLKEESGQHTTNIYIPSIKRDIPFKPISTADVKTLSRIGIFNEFDLNNELMKLALFDKLTIETKESCGVDSESILPIDLNITSSTTNKTTGRISIKIIESGSLNISFILRLLNSIKRIIIHLQ